MNEKTRNALVEAFGSEMRKVLVEQTPEIVRALMDIPRRENVGQAYAQNRGVTGHDISVGGSETEPVISRAQSLAGREEIFVVNIHGSQSLYLGKTRGIAAGTDPGRIPLGTSEVLQTITIPWPASQDVWIFGSGAATTGLIIETARGGR